MMDQQPQLNIFINGPPDNQVNADNFTKINITGTATGGAGAGLVQMLWGEIYDLYIFFMFSYCIFQEMITN